MGPGGIHGPRQGGPRLAGRSAGLVRWRDFCQRPRARTFLLAGAPGISRPLAVQALKPARRKPLARAREQPSFIDAASAQHAAAVI
ncbi:unnamed protein product [Amoebophrya sp. A120]|nr:unnamed protein product [Amoebophrya sp. A120]|eukprot:GSA120T00023946001.1